MDGSVGRFVLAHSLQPVVVMYVSSREQRPAQSLWPPRHIQFDLDPTVKRCVNAFEHKKH